MLKIRLQRVARKHIPIFRVVVIEARYAAKGGKAKEVLGTFNLVTDEKRVNVERVNYWISKGAQPSGTLHNFFVGEGIIQGKKRNVLPKRRPIVKESAKEEKVATVPAGEKAEEPKAPEPAEAPQAAE